MAKPNLALIPATIGDKVYSILPSDGVGDFDFTRGTSATRINAQGLIETVASGENRLNYSLLDGEVVGCPHLLLEDEATNLIVNSEAISLSPIKNGTFTDNFAISPDGTQNATKLTATDTDPYFYQSVSFAAATYTASIYVKGIGGSIGKDFRIVLGGSSSNPKLKIPSEWTRFEYSVSMASGSANAGFEIIDPAVVGDEILVWGWQVEEGSFSSSYIPNYGTLLGVTRAAETCNGSGDAATFNDSEGVLMVEASALAKDGTNRYISISDSSDANRLYLRYRASNNVFSGSVVVNNSLQVLFDTTDDNILHFSKFLLKYKENDFEFWLNGFKLLVDTNGSTFPNGTLNQLRFDTGGTGVPFYGNTKQIQYFDSALDSAQLEELTSWDSFRAMAEGQLYSIQ